MPVIQTVASERRYAIAAAISLLTTIDEGKMLMAAGVVATLGLVMSAIVKHLTEGTLSKNELAKTVNETPTERVIKRVVGAIEKVGMIAAAMALLPEIIRAFGEAKKIAP